MTKVKTKNQNETPQTLNFEIIKNASKKLIKLQNSNKIRSEIDMKPFISRAKYFLMKSQTPRCQETLCIFIHNIVSQLIRFKNYTQSEKLIKRILQYLAFLKDYTQSLVLGSYCEVLLGLNKIKESKSYSIQSINLIEKDVHDRLRNVKKLQAELDTDLKKKIYVLLTGYIRLIRVIKSMKNNNLSTTNLPKISTIVKKAQRMNEIYLKSSKISEALLVFTKSRENFRMSRKMFDKSTVSTSLPVFKPLKNDRNRRSSLKKIQSSYYKSNKKK